MTVPIVFAGLVGAIVWNLVTWYFSMPVLVLARADRRRARRDARGRRHRTRVVWSGILAKVIVPALLAPFICGGVAYLATRHLVRRSPGTCPRSTRAAASGSARSASSSLVALAHGTNDAQKTMGVVTLTLIAGGRLGGDEAIPLWVKVVVRRGDRAPARSRAAGA